MCVFGGVRGRAGAEPGRRRKSNSTSGSKRSAVQVKGAKGDSKGN